MIPAASSKPSRTSVWTAFSSIRRILDRFVTRFPEPLSLAGLWPVFRSALIRALEADRELTRRQRRQRRPDAADSLPFVPQPRPHHQRQVDRQEHLLALCGVRRSLEPGTTAVEPVTELSDLRQRLPSAALSESEKPRESNRHFINPLRTVTVALSSSFNRSSSARIRRRSGESEACTSGSSSCF